LLKGLRRNRGGLNLADAERTNGVVRRRNRHLWQDFPSLTSGGGLSGPANSLLASVSTRDEERLYMFNELLLGQAEVIVE